MSDISSGDVDSSTTNKCKMHIDQKASMKTSKM